jgi:hypothetical protein
MARKASQKGLAPTSQLSKMQKLVGSSRARVYMQRRVHVLAGGIVAHGSRRPPLHSAAPAPAPQAHICVRELEQAS